MGRRPDPPGLQEEKGNPGKRRTAAVKRAEAAAKVAAVLAPAASSAPTPPPMLQDPLFAGALAVWNHLAPELIRTHRLPPEARSIFVTFCIYTAEWTASAIDLAENGATQNVKTVAGGSMERRRPVEARRERAFDNMLRLSERFGLTPHDLYSLFKDQAAAASNNPGLFDNKPPAPEADQPPAPQTGGLVGAAGRLRSDPPRLN